ncbi:MAG: polymer-forming cytoskeletal protein [Lysobacterales bacterium]
MFGSKDKSVRPSTEIDTLIGARTTIRGDVHFSGGLRVDGRVIGSVIADAADAVLMVSDKGVIEGGVNAPHLVINGRIIGDIVASERIELATQARIDGNITYKLLEMAAGAQVNGRIARDQPVVKPAADGSPKGEAAAAATPGAKAASALEAKTESKPQSRLDARRA